ncbi:hypothetical protein COT29_02030 [Candidatus Micrarchaeota archaeon CG08_land_8_20_14_0_20_59_11]|nr:MAG: hypothetical protein COT29_02030 [Candidatus Micrarchaeota archaeon CG08_land_8_20_14_0_20_59_11]
MKTGKTLLFLLLCVILLSGCIGQRPAGEMGKASPSPSKIARVSSSPSPTPSPSPPYEDLMKELDYVNSSTTLLKGEIALHAKRWGNYSAEEKNEALLSICNHAESLRLIVSLTADDLKIAGMQHEALAIESNYSLIMEACNRTTGMAAAGRASFGSASLDRGTSANGAFLVIQTGADGLATAADTTFGMIKALASSGGFESVPEEEPPEEAEPELECVYTLGVYFGGTAVVSKDKPATIEALFSPPTEDYKYQFGGFYAYMTTAAGFSVTLSDIEVEDGKATFKVKQKSDSPPVSSSVTVKFDYTVMDINSLTSAKCSEEFVVPIYYVDGEVISEDVSDLALSDQAVHYTETNKNPQRTRGEDFALYSVSYRTATKSLEGYCNMTSIHVKVSGEGASCSAQLVQTSYAVKSVGGKRMLVEVSSGRETSVMELPSDVMPIKADCTQTACYLIEDVSGRKVLTKRNRR